MEKEGKKTYDVIIWGSSAEYDKYARSFSYEVAKGNMRIKAVTLNEEGIMGRLDGLSLIKIEEILSYEFDYLIDMNREEHQTVLRILEILQIPLDKVIPARVFLHPTFDLRRWVQVKESNVSLISNNCWGGFTYHAMGLKFYSPFINMFLREESYLKLLENFEYYMACPICMIEQRYEANLKRDYPVMGLEDVRLHFNHYTDAESAAAIWNKRRNRLNYDNLLVEMLIKTPEALKRFQALSFRHKIGFTMLKCEEKDVISFGNYPYYVEKYAGADWRLVNNMADWRAGECKVYDVLKLLNHERDYRRMW